MPRNTSGLRRGGGRPKGVPNTVTVEIRDAARAIVENPAYVDGLKARVIGGTAPHMETLLFYYAYGKPKDITEHQGQVRLRVTWEQ